MSLQHSRSASCTTWVCIGPAQPISGDHSTTAATHCHQPLPVPCLHDSSLVAVQRGKAAPRAWTPQLDQPVLAACGALGGSTWMCICRGHCLYLAGRVAAYAVAGG